MTRTKQQLLAAVLISIILFALLPSCSTTKQDTAAVNRVLTNPVLKDKVGKEWEKQNPCINDTITKFLEGKVIEKPYKVDSLIPVLDSVKMRGYLDSLNKALRLKFNEQDKDCRRQVNEAFNTGYEQARYELSKQKQQVKQPDTIKYTVEDIRRLNICNDSLNYYKGLLTQKTAQYNEQVQERKSIGANLKYLLFSLMSKWWFWVILAAIGGYLFRKPLLKLIA